MKKRMAFVAALGVVLVTSISALTIFNNGLPIFAFIDHDPLALTLDGNNRDTSLSTDEKVDTTKDYIINTYTTIEMNRVSGSSGEFCRLNKNKTGEPSFFLKKQPSKGMTSFTIKLSYGTVDVLTGFEPGVYTYKYSINADTPTKGSGTITKTVKGDYFKVINNSTEYNAKVTTFSINYDCYVESDGVTYSYNSSTEKYDANVDIGTRDLTDVARMTSSHSGTNLIPACAIGGTFGSNQYSLLEDAKVFLTSYSKVATDDARLVLMLSNSTTLNTYLDDAVDVYLNDTKIQLSHTLLSYNSETKYGWYEYDCGQVSLIAGNNTFSIKSKGNNGLYFGYFTFVDSSTASNPVTGITASSNEYYLTSGQNSTVCADPGKWYYFADQAAYVRATQPVYVGGTISGAIGYLSQSTDGQTVGKMFIRYQPEQWVANKTLYYSLKIKTNFTGRVLVADKPFDVTAGETKICSGSYTLKQSTSFTISLRQITIPSDGNGLTYEISEVSFFDTEMTEGTMSTVYSNPNHWYYHANGGSKVFAHKSSTETSARASITPQGKSDYYLRFYLNGTFGGETYSDGDSYTMSFDFYSPIDFVLLVQVTNLKSIGESTNDIASINIKKGFNSNLSFNDVVREKTGTSTYHVLQFIMKSSVIGIIEISNVSITKN